MIALTIFNSPSEIKLLPSSIWRDIGIYIIATLMTLYFGYVGQLTFTSAIVMLCLYAFLVIVVYIEELRMPKNEEEGKPENKEEPIKDKQKDVELQDVKNKEGYHKLEDEKENHMEALKSPTSKT